MNEKKKVNWRSMCSILAYKSSGIYVDPLTSECNFCQKSKASLYVDLQTFYFNFVLTNSIYTKSSEKIVREQKQIIKNFSMINYYYCKFF